LTGLGKTLTTLASLEKLEGIPCLIVAPKFALYVWESEITEWLEEHTYIYTGTPKQRREVWKQFIIDGGKFLVTNYSMLGEIASLSGIKGLEYNTAVKDTGNFKWQAMVCDEIHLGGLFNYKNQAYKILLKLARKVPVRFLLTGTPFRQGCKDLFGPLSIIDPVRFNSYWKFVHTYCIVTKTFFGKTIERNPANLDAFRSLVRKYMIRRLKTDVLKELPIKTRQILYVDMNGEQKKIYKQLTEDLIAEIPDSNDVVITPSQVSLILRQRQILACPQVLGLKRNAAGLDLIIAHSHLTIDSGNPIAIFTPFRKGIEDISAAFLKEYPKGEVYILRGQMTAEEFGDTWKGFQSSRNPERVLICVIKSGASFQATKASTAYFLGFEWDFTLDEQAEDRLYRMGQQNNVNIYYVINRGTVDELVKERINEKKRSSDLVMSPNKQYQEILKRIKGQYIKK